MSNSPSPEARRLKQAIAASDTSAAALSVKIGRSKDYLRDFIIGRKQSISAADWAALESELKHPAGSLAPKARPIRPASFDPDAPDPLDEVHPDSAALPPAPPRAIRELDLEAGLGGGGVVQVRYIRDGDVVEAKEAVKNEFWQIPDEALRDMHTKSSTLVVLGCRGDSMQPTIGSGDRVFVDMSKQRLTEDGLYAIRNDFDAIVVKRLQVVGPETIRISSDNPAHAALERPADQVAIIGAVVGVLRVL